MRAFVCRASWATSFGLVLSLIACGGSTPAASAPPGGAEPSSAPASAPAPERGPTLAASVCPPGPYGAPLPASVPVQRIAAVPPPDAFNQQNGTFGNVEGAVWTGDALYVSEMGPGENPPPSRILRIAPDDSVTVVRPDAGTNGLALDARGKLYGASHKVGGLVRIELGAKDQILFDSYQGARLDSPNDLAIRSDGVIYFTDPDYQAPKPPPQPATRLYRWSPASGVVALDDLPQPNGVTLSLDESKLYVATPEQVFAYSVNPDGTLGARSGFSAGACDGMVIDCAGNLYITRGTQVVVLAPSGAELGRIDVSGVQLVTNVAFGGPDRTVLYITALGTGTQKGLFKAQLAVPGLPY